MDEGDVCILEQKLFIVDLAASGGDTTAAETGLQMLEQTQADRLEHIERILEALDEIPLLEEDAQS